MFYDALHVRPNLECFYDIKFFASLLRVTRLLVEKRNCSFYDKKEGAESIYNKRLFIALNKYDRASDVGIKLTLNWKLESTPSGVTGHDCLCVQPPRWTKVFQITFYGKKLYQNFLMDLLVFKK